MRWIGRGYDVMDHSVQHESGRRRFEIHIADATAHLEYEERGPILVLTHTFVPPSLRGRGLAGQLTKTALDFARQAGKTVDPQCSYVASYLDQHPEYADLRVSR